MLVLANFADMTEQTTRYAAGLGAPLHLRLTLLRLDGYPTCSEPSRGRRRGAKYPQRGRNHG